MQHVYWVIERELCGRPGPHKVAWDTAALRAAGIQGVVSLDGPIDADALSQTALAHLPVYQPMIVLQDEQRQREFLSQLPPIFRFIDDCRQQGGAALVHCYHGWDRTGTVLACYLVARRNLTAKEAINVVRNVNLDAMGTVGYEEAVVLFEQMFTNDSWKI